MGTTIKIGRDKSNDIEINEPRVSRNHAIITDLGDGKYEIKDLGSTNGTYVNGNRISIQIITNDDRVEVAGSLVNWFTAFRNPKRLWKFSPVSEDPFGKIRKTISVGSSFDNDIVINDEFVSGHHATISIVKKGNYFIRDLASTNGTYVNTTRVSAKNFTRTDIIKIGSSDLPANWFGHTNLQRKLFNDHRTTWIVSISFLFIIACALLYHFFSCKWFNCGCNLSAEQIYSKNKNSIVRIVHSYYYKIDYEGRTYIVGKNKLFKITEANPSRDNLLPYNTVEGSGCFIKNEGTILTSNLIANPWLNRSEQSQMLKEVLVSKTIKHFSLENDFQMCGETSALKWLACGLIDNQQNYIEANASISCILRDSDTFYATIQSVKRKMPEYAAIVTINYDSTRENHLNRSQVYFYSSLIANRPDLILQDTFYSARDTFNINKLLYARLNEVLPLLNEGSAVLNNMGELIGIVHQNRVSFIHRNY